MDAYFSVDIEADGPIPGQNSMLSLGAVAFDEYGKELDSFKVNLEPIPGAVQDPETMEWWDGQGPEVWRQATEGAVSPEQGMTRFVLWVQKHAGDAVFVGYPASYDFMWVYWYMMKFVGRSPFGFSGMIDIKTLAWATGIFDELRKVSKETMPKEWFEGVGPHTHDALVDAKSQGQLFFNIKKSLEDDRFSGAVH